MYWTDDIDLIQQLEHGLVTDSIDVSRQRILGQLLAEGLVSTQSHNACLEVFKASNEHMALYDGVRTGFFSYAVPKIDLDLTIRCNFRCVHCNKRAGEYDHETELPEERLEAIILGFAAQGGIEIIYMGGEPTLHPQFFSFAELAASKGILRQFFGTNGWNIDRAFARRTQRIFAGVQLSLHGARPATHEAITQISGSYVRALAALESLVEVGMNVNLCFTVMHENRSEIPTMIRLARQRGAHSVRLVILAPLGRGKEIRPLSDEDRSEVEELILQAVNEYPEWLDRITASGFHAPKARRIDACLYGCIAGRTMLHVSSNGRYSCCPVVESDLGCLDPSDFLGAWHQERLVQLRRSLQCECSFGSLCGGPCRFYQSDPYSTVVCKSAPLACEVGG